MNQFTSHTADGVPESVTDPRIPITVIAGFLGSGKTTLVNHLLRQTAGQFGARRVGVIVNEFGKMGVDGGLIEQVLDAPQDVQELTAGCLCCSGREDLIQALVVLAHRGQQEGGAPAHVLIELSGVADPMPVLHTLLEQDVKQVFRLDSLLTVVDTPNLLRTLSENPELALQIAYATTVVLNKIDLVDEKQKENAKNVVAGLQPLTHIIEAEQGKVQANAVMNMHGFAPEWRPPAIQTQHTAGLKSFVLQADEPLTLASWYAFVERMVSRPGQVLRVKGQLSLNIEPHKLLLQAVRDVISIDVTDQPSDGQTRLVVIGRDLVLAEEQAAFAEILAIREKVPS